MTFTEDFAGGIHDHDSQGAAVAESQYQTNLECVSEDFRGLSLDLSFDAKQAGDGKAGAFHHSLKPSNPILDLTERAILPDQLTDTGAFFDELEHNARDFN